MRYSDPARRTSHRKRSVLLVALALVTAAVLGILGRESLGASTATPTRHAPASASLVQRSDERLPGRPPGGHGTVGVADGAVPTGVTVFDDHYPAVTDLDPSLRGALRDAAAHAAKDGVTLYVNSGWRSRAYQEQLFRDAVATYGSEQTAARWVARPGTSVHEAGEAVDLGHADATTWLSRHGAAYGLCQVYRNESWHFELRPDASDHGCPALYADPAHDPRMQQ